MKKFVLLLCAISLIFGLVGVAGATVLTFDNITSGTGSGLITTSYGGFIWENFSWFHKDVLFPGQPLGGHPYEMSTVSGEYGVANWDITKTASISGGLFNFYSAWLTSPFLDKMEIEVKGWSGGTVLYSDTVYPLQPDPTDPLKLGPTEFVFNYFGIDQLTFGTTESNFAMDNFNASPVPEPATLLMLGFGLVGLAGLGRKRFHTKG